MIIQFDIPKMRAIVPIRVRKLTGKPAFLTIADCESEASRIQLGIGMSLFAGYGKDFLIS